MSLENRVRDLEAEVERLRSLCSYADAVARVWIVNLMSDDRSALFAHPLAMVREALRGVTEPKYLGCRDRELELALKTSDVSDLRLMILADERGG